MIRRINERCCFEALTTIFVLLLWSPIAVLSGGYDGFGDGGGTSNGAGVNINDYASNNGQIPNHLVCEPTVSCGAESVSIDLQTTSQFGGRIFVKGYSQDPNCMLNGSGARVLGFSINFDQCGLRRTRELNGVSVSATVVISFHPIFITKADRAYKVSCFYMEARKTLGQDLEVSEMTTRAVSRTASLPVCRYEILNSPNGQIVRYAKIGDQIYHKWTCDTDVNDIYCMKVHSCTVNDGQGGDPVFVLDENGCEIDRYVLQNLDYPGDLIGGQWAYVFKFADKPTLHFNCAIELALKDRQAACTKTHPQCPTEGYRKGPSLNSYGRQYTNVEEYQTEVMPSQLETGEYGDTAEAHETMYTMTPGVGHSPGYSPNNEKAQRFGVNEQPNGADYKRIVKRDDRQKIADFDLPEQSLVVIEIDDENKTGTDSLLTRRSQHHVAPASNKICLSSTILAGLFGCCAIFCGCIAVFFFGALRRHREAFQKNMLKF